MLGKKTIIVTALIVVGIVSIAIPLGSISAATNSSSDTAIETTRGDVFGPYATLERADEVAEFAQTRGYQTKVITKGSSFFGSPSYTVDVWK